MADFLGWAISNPTYAFGAMAGIALGAFYGFDGWRGSTEEVEFKDSPRTKNLLWVATAAFAALIGDLKAIDGDAKKSVLLFVYFFSFLVAAILVVGIWGLIVFIDSVRRPRRFKEAYSTGDAVGDYFYYGYRRYRTKKEQAEEVFAKKGSNFLGAYLEQLSYSLIAAAPSPISGPERETVARELLRTMSTVVQRYRGGHTNAQIHANLMMICDCTDELRSKMRFSVSSNHVDRCLVLWIYDQDVQRELVLPLADTAEEALPGAPGAILHERPMIIDDTSSIDYPVAINAELKKRMQEYFASKEAHFKSFASFMVVGRGRPIGVVNIECSETNVFMDEDGKKELGLYLLPFCSLLGILLR